MGFYKVSAALRQLPVITPRGNHYFTILKVSWKSKPDPNMTCFWKNPNGFRLRNETCTYRYTDSSFKVYSVYLTEWFRTRYNLAKQNKPLQTTKICYIIKKNAKEFYLRDVPLVYQYLSTFVVRTNRP